MIKLTMLHIHLECSSNEKWFLRIRFQTSIINNVQCTANLQNIVLPDIY